MDKVRLEKTITVKEAQALAKSIGINITIPTLISWVKDNWLGHQPGGSRGRWYIYKDRFLSYIKGGNK